ncbi:membrane dipeptidase [Chitinophaga skermanii]|uniref:Membrane dipeptidase n=1 Tax=Chitinophaga skermanii TaxID=331697 RepID=A0A327QLT9_9BACT|nr:membrane dipeptidase [Chitinophaga skermanii]RAJ04313.1 membrane dipeptidase [Chitinophaga skermanii]
MHSLIFDAHLDLSMNAMEWNRDLTQSVPQIRKREEGLHDKPDRGRGTVSFPAMREGRVGLCVATQIARFVAPNNPLPGWHSQEQAWAQTQGQLAYYKAMEAKGEMVQITTAAQLKAHVELWEAAQDTSTLPIGYILSLEGADSFYDLSCVEKAYNNGLRAVGPAHYGPGVYAFGTDSTGSLGVKGKALLKELERFNIILDATHLCDECFWEAMDAYAGPVWASHHNSRSIVNHNRQFSDEQFKVLIERGAVIGAAFDAWMLVPNWVRGVSTPQSTGVTMQNVADQIDHICQLAGNSHHSAIGSDLDGAFGTEQSPGDLDTIADLQKLPTILQQRGYAQQDIDNILGKNWINFLVKAWGA